MAKRYWYCVFLVWVCVSWFSASEGKQKQCATTLQQFDFALCCFNLCIDKQFSQFAVKEMLQILNTSLWLFPTGHENSSH